MKQIIQVEPFINNYFRRCGRHRPNPVNEPEIRVFHQGRFYGRLVAEAKAPFDATFSLLSLSETK